MNGCMRNRIPANGTAFASCLLALGCLSIMPAHAAAQEERTNAAYWYQRALERVQSLPESQREILNSIDASAGVDSLSPQARSLLVDLRPALELVRRGSAQQYSDFGLDHSQGIDMGMPHLGSMRQVGNLLGIDAKMRLESGDSSGAAESLATLYRMSDHMCDDRVMISSLVGQSLSSQADGVTQRAIDEGKLNAGDAMTLLKASSRFMPDDPFRYGEAVMAEQEFMISTIEDTLLAAEPERTPAELAGQSDGEQIPLELLGMDKDAMRVDMSQLDLMMDRVVEAFLIPDRERGEYELNELMKEVENGEHGVFATFVMPALTKVHERMAESESQLDERMQSLRKIASGEVTPGEAANAALWYLRAIEMLEKIPDEKREMYRAVAADPAPLASEVVQELLGVRDPIGLLIEASRMKRCDFTFAREAPHRLKRDYALGMRDAVRLLHAQAIRIAQSGDYDTAADRLGVCFRMSKHLGDDQAILSSLLAYDIFTRTATLYDEILAPHADDELKKTLLADVEKTSRKDPFGYIGGIVNDRALALNWLHDLGATAPAQHEAAPYPSPKKLVYGWDANRLLNMLALFDALRHAPTDPSDNEADPALNFALIKDVVSLDHVGTIHVTAQAMRAKYPTPLTPESRRAMFESLIELELPDVAAVRDRIGQARQTVRDMYRKLTEGIEGSRDQEIRGGEAEDESDDSSP